MRVEEILCRAAGSGKDKEMALTDFLDGCCGVEQVYEDSEEGKTGLVACARKRSHLGCTVQTIKGIVITFISNQEVLTHGSLNTKIRQQKR